MIDAPTHAPPHALGPEKSVLSSMLKDPGIWIPAALEDGLAAGHFHLPAHGRLFEVLRELHDQGAEIELVSLVQLLHDRGHLASIGGAAAISEIYTYAPNAAHFGHHLALVRGKHVLRSVIVACGDIIAEAHENPEDSAALLDSAERRLRDIRERTATAKPEQSAASILATCLGRFEARLSGAESPMGIETSLVEINRRFRGLHGKHTIVISGYPGGGKTTLAGQLAMDAALEGAPALICSLEMPRESMMDRMLSYVSRRPGQAITDPRGYCRETLGKDAPDREMLMAIKQAFQRIKESPLSIVDCIGGNVHQIAGLIRGEHRRRGLRVAVVDFAQRIRAVPEMRRETREQQLAHASNMLADLAKELDLCLILPSQLNKDGAPKHAEALNEDADLHLQIVQDRNGTPPTFEHLGLGVPKDRHFGQAGELLPIVLDAPMLRFTSKPPRQ